MRTLLCDECSVRPALIDHLDLRGRRSRARRLCPACADAEMERWRRERLEPPALVLTPPDLGSRAA